MHLRISTYHKLRKENKPISYSTIREKVLDAISKIRLNPRHFGLHSLLYGGATVATNNGVNDILFKRRRRWRSDRAKDDYVKDSIKYLLSVSSRLGL